MIIKIEKYHNSIRYRVLLKSGSVIRPIWERLQQIDRLRERERKREREREREREGEREREEWVSKKGSK